MKFSYYKKAVAFLAAVSLTATLAAGCGSQNDTKGSSQSGTPAQAGSSSAASASSGTAAKDPLGKYDPAIDISFVRCIDNDLSSNILPKTPGETIEDNRWLKLYSDELGINIKYDWTVNGGYNEDAYKQKINVTLASADLPDVVPVNSSQLKQLADSDMIEDMTQYFKDYASPMTQQVYTQEGTSLLDSATFEGKLMAVPNADASIESAQFLWIRADWLKKLGLEPPKTMDDLLKISEAFTTRDPDGNRKDDTYGLAITKDLYSGCMGLEGFFAGYHAYPNFWQENSDGKLAYGSVQPQMKIALQKLADMYKAGQIDKEFGVKDGGKVAETIAAGRVGIDFGEQWNPMYPLISNYNNDNNADWTGYSLVSADSEPLKVPLKFRTSLYFAVKKGYEHPEAVVKLVNMHIEKNWGETNDFGKYYMPAENGNVGVWKYSPVTPYPPYKNLNAFLDIEKARNANDMSILKGEPKVIEANIEAYASGDKSQWGWEKIYGVNGVYNHLKKNQADNALMVEKFVGAPTPTMVERKATLDKMEKEEFVKIIMGAAPVDEFDKFVSDWNKLGGEAITREVNEWYDSVKAK
jgi:putative aldouronate transport system substrate-binding protein